MEAAKSKALVKPEAPPAPKVDSSAAPLAGEAPVRHMQQIVSEDGSVRYVTR